MTKTCPDCGLSLQGRDNESETCSDCLLEESLSNSVSKDDMSVSDKGLTDEQYKEKPIMNDTTYKKPKSWKEAEALPFVSFIEKEPNRPSDELSIWVQLNDDVDNPVTGEVGSGFYVCNFYDFLSHYWL